MKQENVLINKVLKTGSLVTEDRTVLVKAVNLISIRIFAPTYD